MLCEIFLGKVSGPNKSKGFERYQSWGKGSGLSKDRVERVFDHLYALGVLELESDPERAVEAIVAQAEAAVHEDRAEVICLGCGGMAELETAVRERTGVPVVDGVAAAVTVAESLVRLGLSTSKVRTYAPPRLKRIDGWPLA